MADRDDLRQATEIIPIAAAPIAGAQMVGAAIAEPAGVKRSPVARVLNTVLFFFTLLVSLGVIAAVILATPFVILLSSIAELFDSDSGAFGWTVEDVSENAQ